MVRVLEDCDECRHKTTCWKFGYLSTFKNRLSKAPYKGYDFDTYANHFGFTVDISCKDFERQAPKPRKASS